jgi:hypothetical protein
MSTEANCEHQWWVYSTAIADPPKIMVQCRLCKVLGSTEHYTKGEWGQAYHAPSEPYEWEGTVEHIGQHDNELASGIPAPEDKNWNELMGDRKAHEAEEATYDQIAELIEQSNDMFTLSSFKRLWEERMKVLAAEVLKPGSDETIKDMHALDYIWGLGGDNCIRGDAVYHPSALDYYLGRTVSHVWGEGKLVRFIRSDDEILDIEREHFGDALVVEDELRGRGYRYGISLKMPCHCGKKDFDMYAVPGVHTGGFAYLIMAGMENLFDVRNHTMVCDECGPKVEQQLERITRGGEERRNAERSGETTGDSGESG